MYTNEATGSEASRLSFAGEYLGGDASLLISDLLLTDSGEYYCKVKTGGKYHWSQVNLIVLGECSSTYIILIKTHIRTYTDTLPTRHQAMKKFKSICKVNGHTHKYSISHTHGANHWIISLAHFLRHAD